MTKTINIALIGNGAIAKFVVDCLEPDESVSLAAIVARGEGDTVRKRLNLFAPQYLECAVVRNIDALPHQVDLVVDCAGHSGLAEHGPAALAAGFDMISISTGALADPGLAGQLEQAARQGGSSLKLLAGAIGGIDVLTAGTVGDLQSVKYTGRKPPEGWLGSPAETQLDLNGLQEPAVHFEGTARAAALAYPKNANVAATVALAGLGLDQTRVTLIADPNTSRNTHEVQATGSFGTLKVTLAGNPLADNPKSSALAAMSVVEEIRRRTRPIQI